MKALTAHFQKKPVISFFVLTFGISWTMFILALKLFPENEILQAPFINLGAFAPSLVSIMLAGRIDPRRSPAKNRKRTPVFFLVWLVAGVNLCLFATTVSGALPWGVPLIVTAALLALLPAYVISSAFSRVEGVRAHLASLCSFKRLGGRLLLAILMIPAVLLLGHGLTTLLGRGIPEADYPLRGTGAFASLLTIVLVFLTHLINSGGVAEEPGWRGFALGRLLKKTCPLAAGMLVGALWALWHIPVMLGAVREFGPLLAVLQVTHLGIIFTWVYIHTRGSLLAVALLHASWNAGGAFLPRTPAFHFLMTVLVIVFVVYDRMWKSERFEGS